MTRLTTQSGQPAAGEPAPTAPWARVRHYSRLVLGREGSVRRPVAFLILALIIATIITPDFIRPTDIESLLINSSFLVVIAAGEAFVIMVGSIDLGVEALLASFGMILAWLTVLHSVPTGLALVATLAAALVVGLLVGFLVAKVHIPSFVVTLGVYWGFRGVALLVHNQQYISPSSVSPARQFGFDSIAGNAFGISNFTLVLIAFVVVVVCQAVLSLTPYGLWLKSIGSNEQAARRAGLRADLLKMSVFAVSAVLATLAGIMLTAYQGSIYPDSAAGYSLQAIAAVILGGIPFTGGRGTVTGAALGALLIGVINTLIVLLGLPSQYEYVFVAIVLVIAGLQARGGDLVK
ncbi:MAG: ABC transporter permease [Nocardiopsaceae bacterium]|nr:ABC transporter permease [Nocardiopsaceae bacterium]